MNFKWCLTIVLIHFWISCFACEAINLEVTEDFLEANKARICLVFFCDQSFNYKLQRLMQKLSIWSAFQDTAQVISDPNKLFHSRTLQISVIYDLQCPGTKELFDISFREHIFNASYHWLMFHNDLGNALDLLRPQNINWDAEITLTIEQDNEDVSQIYDVYNPSFERGGQLNVTLLGEWNRTIRDLRPFKVPNKNIHRRNMWGLQFKASSVLTNVPRNRSYKDYLEGEDNFHLDTLHRLNYHLMKIVMEMCNFTTFVYRTKSWGYYRNGSWDGGIGLLVKGKTDFGMAGLIPFLERVGWVDYTPGWLSFLVPRFLFRHPKNVQIRNVFLLPFETHLWLGIFVLLLLFGISLIVIRLVKTIIIKKSTILANKLLDMVVESLLVPIGIMSQQGFHGNFKLMSARISLLIILLFAFIIGQFYSTYIVGSLLMEAPRTITNMAQLVDSGMPVIFENVLYILRYFDSTNDVESLRLFKRIEKDYNSLLHAPLDGIKLVKRGGDAFHVDPPGVYKAIKETFTESEVCDLQEILMFPARPMFLTVRKGSPIKELIAVCLRRQIETAITKHHQQVWEESRPECALNKEFEPVDLQHFSTLLMSLAFGITLSFSILVLEILFHRFQQIISRVDFYQKGRSLHVKK